MPQIFSTMTERGEQALGRAFGRPVTSNCSRQLEVTLASEFRLFTNEDLVPGKTSLAHPPVLDDAMPSPFVVVIAAMWKPERALHFENIRRAILKDVWGWDSVLAAAQVFMNIITDPNLLRTPIREFFGRATKLEEKTARCLEAWDIVTVGDLVDRKEGQISIVDGIGPSSLEIIKSRLSEKGLWFRPEF